jgi:hypothetical protein
MTTEELQAIKEAVREVVQEEVREIVQEEVREIAEEIVQEELREVVRETVQDIIEEEVGDIVGDELSGIEDCLSDLEHRGAASNARLELVGKNLHILRKMLIQLDRRMGERFAKLGSPSK